MALMGAVIIGVILSMAAGLLDVVAVASARTRAQVAADAAALAAAPATFSPVSSPRAAASRMARANGARLVRCLCRVDRRPVPRKVSTRTDIPVRLWVLGRVTVSAEAHAEFTPYPGEHESQADGKYQGDSLSE